MTGNGDGAELIKLRAADGTRAGSLLRKHREILSGRIRPPVQLTPPGVSSESLAPRGFRSVCHVKSPNWLGIAAFSASTGAALVSAGFTNAGLIIGAIGAGYGGVGSFIRKERSISR